jgi:hypothetical protein
MLMGLFKRNSSREYDMGNPAKQVLILIVLFLLILFIILAHPTLEWVNSSEPTIRVGPIVGEFQPLLEPWTG